MLLTLFYRWTRRTRVFRLQAGDVRLTRAAGTCLRAVVASAADIPRQCAIASFYPALQLRSGQVRATRLTIGDSHTP